MGEIIKGRRLITVKNFIFIAVSVIALIPVYIATYISTGYFSYCYADIRIGNYLNELGMEKRLGSFFGIIITQQTQIEKTDEGIFERILAEQTLPERTKGGFFERILAEQTLTGWKKLMLGIVAWKKETPNITHNYSFIVERNWFFGGWKIVTIKYNGEAKWKP